MTRLDFRKFGSKFNITQIYDEPASGYRNESNTEGNWKHARISHPYGHRSRNKRTHLDCRDTLTNITDASKVEALLESRNDKARRTTLKIICT